MSLRILLLKKSWPETKGAQRNRGNAGPPLISWVKEASGGFILAQIYEIFHQILMARSVKSRCLNDGYALVTGSLEKEGPSGGMNGIGE